MSNDQLTRTFSIPSYRMETLEATLEKLGKKATKHGCMVPTYKVLREFTVTKGDAPNTYEVAYSEVEVTYEVIALAGDWRFIASIETMDRVDGVARNRVSGPRLSNEDASNYITVEQKCDHCGHNRKRNQTYIVKNALGETKQIGSTCLMEYLGVDPTAAVAGLTFDADIKSIGEDEETWGCGSSAPWCFPLDKVAAAALSIMAKNGFVSASDAEYGNKIKTGSDMLNLLLPTTNANLQRWQAEMAPSQENKDAANAIVERLSNRILPDYKGNPTALDSFAFKLGIILNRKVADCKDFQLFASAVLHESGIIAKENTQSGIKRNELLPGATEGAKLEFRGTIQSVKEVFSSFGSSMLVVFVSDSGHMVKTFYSGNKQEWNPGAVVSVKGTVKKLEVSEKWGASVMLSRVKIVA